MKNLLFALMLTVLGTFFISGSAVAQSLEPVKWTHEVVKLDDGSFQVDFTAAIDKGWYLYSQNIEEGGPQPTTIEFAGKGVEVAKEITEKGDLKEGFDELFEMDIRKYGDKVVFSTNVKPLHSK